MKRTQILLEDVQYLQLKDEVSATGKSLSEIVRDSIAAHLRERENDPLFNIIGSVEAKKDPAPANLGTRHDQALYGEKMNEAIGPEKKSDRIHDLTGIGNDPDFSAEDHDKILYGASSDT